MFQELDSQKELRPEVDLLNLSQCLKHVTMIRLHCHHVLTLTSSPCIPKQIFQHLIRNIFVIKISLFSNKCSPLCCNMSNDGARQPIPFIIIMFRIIMAVDSTLMLSERKTDFSLKLKYRNHYLDKINDWAAQSFHFTYKKVTPSISRFDTRSTYLDVH